MQSLLLLFALFVFWASLLSYIRFHPTHAMTTMLWQRSLAIKVMVLLAAVRWPLAEINDNKFPSIVKIIRHVARDSACVVN